MPLRSRAEAAARLHRKHSGARRRAPQRRGVSRRLRGGTRAGTFAIGGELVVMKKGRERRRSAVPSRRSARARAHRRERVPRTCAAKPAASASRSIPRQPRRSRSRPDLFVTDLRSIAVQGLVGPDHLAPLAEAKALLAWHARHRFCANCGAPTQCLAGRLEARMPGLQGRAFPAHRSGRDHAGDRRRPLPARARRALRRRTCGRALRASSSRARASRRRRGARRWRRPASSAAR